VPLPPDNDEFEGLEEVDELQVDVQAGLAAAGEHQQQPPVLPPLPQPPAALEVAAPQPPAALEDEEPEPPSKRRRSKGAAPTRRSTRLQAQGRPEPQLPVAAALAEQPNSAPVVQQHQAEVVDQPARRKGAKKLGPPTMRAALRQQAAEGGWQAFLTPLPTEEVEDEVERRPRSTRAAAKVCKAKNKYLAYARHPNLCL
jgi:hypothetical protein